MSESGGSGAGPETRPATVGPSGGSETRSPAFPFVLVDRVLAAVPFERAVGLRNVTANDPLLARGGGDVASMRRGLLIEAFAQLAGAALSGDGLRPAAVDVSRIGSMRFLRSPVPGDQLVLTVELSRGGQDRAKAACKAEISGELVAEGELEFAAP